VGPGSKELIFQTIYLMEGPLLVPAPSWVSYGPQAALRGKEIIPITTKRDNGYRLQADELDYAAHKLGQSQKLLIINNPNNPTGSVYYEEELHDIAEICRAYHIIVISDEIYSMIDFTNRKFCSLSHYYPEGTIITGGISKFLAAGGYRLGFMLVPDQLSIILKALKSVVSETFSSVSAPIQYSALGAYKNFDLVRPFIKKTSEIYSVASNYMHTRFVEMNLNCPIPEGSFYLFPDFENYRSLLHKHKILTGTALCDKLLNLANVAVLPGSDFYFPATNLGVRIAAVDFDGQFVLDKWPGKEDITDDMINRFFPNLVEGCNQIEKFLQQL
jgi:aspartate/methionine/tyrosine aminotransferase